MKKILILICFSSFLSAQDTVQRFNFSAYLEAYYAYDFSEPTNNVRPSYIYNHKIHNTASVNLALAKVSYSGKSLRASFAIMAGDYSRYNLATEPGVLKNIYELNAGIKLFKNKNIWLDAGILPSHIGFESAIGVDCPNLTRSLLADNSPYYETGIRINYISEDNKLSLAALVLNGWQRIQPLPGNTTPAFGTRLFLTPSSAFLFNWSTFIGNNYPRGFERWRFFNNLYVMFSRNKASLIAGFDIGHQQSGLHTSQYNVWYSPVLILKYNINPQVATSVRWEYYSDPFETMIQTGAPHGFQTGGASVNFDYLPKKFFMLRLEGRALKSRDKIFLSPGGMRSDNFLLTAALAVTIR